MLSNSPFWDKLAIQSYKMILKKNPKSAIAHRNLGLAYVRVSQPRKAVRAFQRAIQCDKTHAEAYYHLGSIYRCLGDNKAAVRCFNNYMKVTTEKKQKDSVVEDLVNKLKS